MTRSAGAHALQERCWRQAGCVCAASEYKIQLLEAARRVVQRRMLRPIQGERAGDIDSKAATLVLDRLQQHMESRYLRQGVSDAVLDGALEMIDRYALRAYDAFQFAGCLALRQRPDQSPQYSSAPTSNCLRPPGPSCYRFGIPPRLPGRSVAMVDCSLRLLRVLRRDAEPRAPYPRAALALTGAKVISPFFGSAPTSMVSPTLTSPSRILSANGSWIRRCKARFSGRAPNCGS